MANSNLTPQRLAEVLEYNPETGVFIMKKMRHQKVAVGRPLPVTFGQYGRIQIDGVRYKLHRLAYLFVNGAWPSGEIDHINGEPSDNRIVNLRDVPHAINVQNKRKAFSSSKSGLLGAYLAPKTGRWLAAMRSGGRTIHIGSFSSAEEAHSAYLAMKRKIHPGCTI